MNYIKYFILLLFTLSNSITFSQNCTVNAGGSVTICSTTYTLAGSAGGNTNGVPTWTIVNKPAGAPDPVISNINSYTPDVTGLSYPGNYVFQISQTCTTGTATSQVTILAPGTNTGFTAGPDITNVDATVGTVILNGVVPAGYTAQWSAYNLWRYERSSGTITSQNSTFGSPTSATTTFSLINKSNHDIDPSYVVTLRITSINNPSCYYEDTAIVRFIPNPQIIVPTSKTECNTTGNSIISFSSGSPIFGTTTAGAAGSPGNGTTVTMNVISQPSGGNIAYTGIIDSFNFSGASIPGVYKFTITVANSSGTYTTPEITYTNQGAPAGYVSFLVPSEPDQMMIYDTSNSGGRVHCGMVGSTAPISFSYTINPADPVTVTSSVVSSGIAPPGGNPSNITTTGSGTATTRTTTVTPPSGGWRAGTYRFLVSTGNGTCPSVSQQYYIHISDGARPNVSVNNITVCYPGSGSVTANVPLPAIYKGVVNSSYFQDFDGAYDFTLVSSPAGAGTPVYQARNQSLFTLTSTTISNLTTPGEYIFKIKPSTYIPSVGAFLDKEYACSGTSIEGTFSIFVSAQVGANAGSDQIVTCPTDATVTLNGNDPGVASNGEWTVVTKPTGVPDPVIADPTLHNTGVNDLNVGVYTFRWTITTGDCISSSDVNLTVTDTDCPAPGGVTGVDFWIKSDDAGDIVTAWKDHSANVDDIPAVGDWTLSPADGNHNFHPYTTGYSNNRNFYNALSKLNPNGTSDAMGHSIFSAVRPASAANGRITGIGSSAATAGDPGVSISSNGSARHHESLNSSTSNDFSTAFNIGRTNIFSAITDNSVANGGGSAFSGGEKRLGLNGTYESFTFINSNRFQLVGRHLRVGHGTASVNGAFPGDIMEVIWYNKALTENEQSRVNSYLAVKNGVTLSEDYLSAASTVVFDQSTNAGYTDNIFGIAKDDASALHQKQSKSVNSGQRLIIGSGSTLAETNADNSNDLDEGQFLIVGDNGLEQGLRVPLAYTGGTNGETNMRFASIWKTQNTGSVGTVTVAWPKGVSNLYLVQSADDIIDAVDTFVPMTAEVTIGDVVYNTATVTLGNYFTFAGFGYAPGGVTNALSYWYRVDIGAENTGVDTDVTGWTDVWNGTTVAQMGDNRLPVYKQGAVDYFNFNAGIYFSGNSNYTNGQTLGNNTVRTLTSLDYDVFTFTKGGITSGGANSRLFSIGMDNTTTGITNWDTFGIWSGNSNLERRVYGGSTHFPGISPNFAADWSIMYFRNTDVSSAKGLNGGVLGTPANYNAQGYQYGGHIFGNTRFSSNGSDNAGFNGDIGETIVYGAGTLTDVERRRVDSYLAIKYGLTLGRVETEHYLDANEELIWNGGVNTSYNNNIFGVAREDVGLFEQKVSKSVNPGSLLTVATINDFVNPNQDAARTGFADDNTYFLLGDNADVTTTAIDINISGVTYNRIPKAWLAQEQSTDAGSLFFEADLMAYNSTGFNATENIVMLVADDDIFATNVTVVDPTNNDLTKWVFEQNVADGKFITFAKLMCFGPDTDGDGIPDMCDLDSDNDGILDEDECGNGNAVTDGIFPTSGGNVNTVPGWLVDGTYSTVWPASTGKVNLDSNGLEFRRDGNTETTLRQDINGLFTLNPAEIYIKDAYWRKTPTGNDPTAVFTLTVSYAGVIYATINSTSGNTPTVNGNNGASVNINTLPSVTTASPPAGGTMSAKTDLIITLPEEIPTDGLLEFRFIASSHSQQVRDFGMASVSISSCVDTDGDSIPDYLDLDSDGDGCPDAIEGDENVDESQLNLDGSIDINANGGIDATGVPNLVNSGGVADINGSQGQGIGDSQDILVIACTLDCSNVTFLSQGTDTRLIGVQMDTNPFTYTEVGTTLTNNPDNITYNGTAFNPLDGYLYAIRAQGTGAQLRTLLRIHPLTGEITTLGPVANLPVPNGTYNAGEIDELGNYYVRRSNSNETGTLYKIEFTSLSATAISLSGQSGAMSSDLAYNKTNGLLYFISNSNNANEGKLHAIDPATGVVSLVGSQQTLLVFGAMYGDANGFIYGAANTGGFYQFNTVTGKGTLLSASPSSGTNDGAHCINSPIELVADLYVTKTDGTDKYVLGDTTTYTVVVGNNGPFGVQDAEVVDLVPVGIPAANVSYTAVPSVGSATAVTGTQTGAINDLVSLPVGGTVTYTVTVTIPGGFTGNLVNTVTVTPPLNISDTDMSNNTATDTNVRQALIITNPMLLNKTK